MRQYGGRIVVVGRSFGNTTASGYNFTLVRFKANGKIDSSFGTNGFTFTDFGAFDIPLAAATQSDGKIITAGYSFAGSDYKLVLARYTINGRLDSSFGVNGSVITDLNTGFAIARGVTIQSDDKILIAASNNTEGFVIARFTKNGKVDNSFGTGGNVIVDFGADYGIAVAVATQTNGKIIAAGGTNFSNNFIVVRLNNDAQSENVVADNSSSVSIKNIATNIKVFPNPVKDVLHITGIKSQATISIFNAEGKLVKQSTANQTSELNTKQLPAGIYYLHVEENAASGKDKKISNIKFVKE